MDAPEVDLAQYWNKALIRVINGPDKGRRGVVTGKAADTLTVLELPYRNIFFVNTCDVKKID